MFRLLLLFLLMPLTAFALVSEGRPGIATFNHPLFLDVKKVENGQVTQVRLAYGDTRDDSPDCLNTVDVFLGLEHFAPVAEKSWVLVDYELQSILINQGFFGDADVFRVRDCGELDDCVALREKLENDPLELAKRAEHATPKNTKKARFNEIDEELEIGRKLVKAARCRACHQIEGFGAEHAPGLTWKRYKYVDGWLEDYLRNPYRLRPAIDDLMMLQYTSANAVPNLQEVEVEAIADFLERVAKAKTPDIDFRGEVWQNYDCFACHTSNYKNQPLPFIPTKVPAEMRAELETNTTLQTCLSCHSFGDYRQVEPAGSDNPNRFAPDLLLALERQDLDFLLNFVQRPDYLQPGSQMPPIPLDAAQREQLRQFVIELRRQIEAGTIQPVYNYYRMKKISE
jgi:mono/diheme cytochrome c family protein